MKEKSGFSGQIGFVLAAAGSAVGVGNLWRFPYLAAKDGGGLFLIVYLCLVLTFGFTLLVSDIAIGRKTKKSCINAYAQLKPSWKGLGVLTFFVPVVIMTYYSVIGGWITKYLTVYMTGKAEAVANDEYFDHFISDPHSSCYFALFFLILTAVVVYNGVEKGIEKFSKFVMPVLLVLIIAIAIYSLFLEHTDASGTARTGLQGFVVYLKPDFTGMTLEKFVNVLLDAMSQLFFSLSVSMGIMITYGSYVKDEVDLNKAVNQIEIFDTVVAFIAGAMIIPAVYCFSGTEGMNGGPGLMFISLPKVFNEMGPVGSIIGIFFFLTAAFAALTSCVSVLEAVTANCMELFDVSRRQATVILTLIYCVATAVISLGYSTFRMEIPLPNGSEGQLLDLMDYISNSVMMPFISLLSCIFIGWVLSPKTVTDEMEKNGEKFGRKGIYNIMIRFIAPVIMLVLFLQSVGLLEKLE